MVTSEKLAPSVRAALTNLQSPQPDLLASRLESCRLDGRPLLAYAPLHRESYMKAALSVFSLPELTLAQAMLLWSQYPVEESGLDRLLTAFRNSRQPAPGLDEMGLALDALGGSGDVFAEQALWRPWWGESLWDWEPSALWPYFARRQAVLRRALQETVGWERRGGPLRAIATFTEIPPELDELFWSLALSGSRHDAPPAQQALVHQPGFESRVVAALADSRQDKRAAAADWLARLRVAAAEPALRVALKKEKQDVPRVAMLRAVAALGGGLDEYLALEDSAQAKAPPEWLPDLPAVRWKNGEPVPSEVVRGWVGRAHKLKQAEVNPVARLSLERVDPADRAVLGRFLLEAWIAQDTRPAWSLQQCRAEAARYASAMRRPGETSEQAERRLFEYYSGLIDSSAIADKGLLALAGACGGPDVPRLAGDYMRHWYGQRAPQCKALLAMLATCEESAAVQQLVGVATRFKTKGIQQEAHKLAQALAERKGWSLGELADRSVSTAGFEPDGTLGGARLTADLTVEGGSGPEVAAARKELKTLVKVQQDRLYQAMCSQRTWRFEDWHLYLWEHPIMRILSQRLVWCTDSVSFRPLADGSLTDNQDSPVQLEPAAEVRLAHRSTLGDAASDAWQQHLHEYEVKPWFEQFSCGPFTPAEGAYEVPLGGLRSPSQLRSQATRLAYGRGETGEDGWVMSYVRAFPELQLQATVHLSGQPLFGGAQETVELLHLTFERLLQPGLTSPLPLSKVPPVLLAECRYQWHG